VRLSGIPPQRCTSSFHRRIHMGAQTYRHKRHQPCSILFAHTVTPASLIIALRCANDCTSRRCQRSGGTAPTHQTGFSARRRRRKRLSILWIGLAASGNRLAGGLARSLRGVLGRRACDERTRKFGSSIPSGSTEGKSNVSDEWHLTPPAPLSLSAF
jgi:hypothetical protein